MDLERCGINPSGVGLIIPSPFLEFYSRLEEWNWGPATWPLRWASYPDRCVGIPEVCMTPLNMGS